MTPSLRKLVWNHLREKRNLHDKILVLMFMLESNHSDTAGSDLVTAISSMGLLHWTLRTELESSPIKTGGSWGQLLSSHVTLTIYIYTHHTSLLEFTFLGTYEAAQPISWTTSPKVEVFNRIAMNHHITHTNHHTNHHKITRQQPCNDHIISQSHFSRCASHALNFCKNALPTRPLPILRCFALTLKDSPTWVAIFTNSQGKTTQTFKETPLSTNDKVRV